MRHTRLLAAGAALLTLAAPAGAQVTAVPAPRPEIAGKEGRTFMIDRDDTPRAALGINTSSTGTRRDTLGLLITQIVRGGPAERAGLRQYVVGQIHPSLLQDIALDALEQREVFRQVALDAFDIRPLLKHALRIQAARHADALRVVGDGDI